jgi:hypothetical protein
VALSASWSFKLSDLLSEAAEPERCSREVAEGWPSGENHPVGAATAAAGITAIVVLPVGLRRAVMTWMAWGLTGLLVVHLGALFG